MTRSLAIVALTAALLASLASIAVAEVPVIVGDDFGSGGYSGSKNSAGGVWQSAWVEVGESDGPSAGSVRVDTLTGCNGSCLVVSGALFFNSGGAHRTAEVSGVHSVSASYRLSFRGLTAASVRVQANVDGSGWTTIGTRSSSGSFSDPIGTSTSTVGIRFIANGLSVGGSIGIDDVSLTFVPEVGTTTTTSSTTSTTSSTTTTSTFPPITIPPITLPPITLPPIITTTTTNPLDITTTTTNPTTTTTVRETTTTIPVPDDRTDDGGLAVPPSDGGPGPDAPQLDVAFFAPAGFTTSFDPGLAPQGRSGRGSLDIVDSLLVRFGMRSEDLSLDLTLYLLLGASLAVISAMKFEHGARKRDRAPDPSGA